MYPPNTAIGSLGAGNPFWQNHLKNENSICIKLSEVSKEVTYFCTETKILLPQQKLNNRDIEQKPP